MIRQLALLASVFHAVAPAYAGTLTTNPPIEVPPTSTTYVQIDCETAEVMSFDTQAGRSRGPDVTILTVQGAPVLGAWILPPWDSPQPLGGRNMLMFSHRTLVGGGVPAAISNDLLQNTMPELLRSGYDTFLGREGGMPKEDAADLEAIALPDVLPGGGFPETFVSPMRLRTFGPPLLHEGRCNSHTLPKDRYERMRDALTRSTLLASAPPTSQTMQRDLFPLLAKTLVTLPLYSARGEYLAGKASWLATAGAAVVLGAGLARALMSASTRGTATAAYAAFMGEDEAKQVLDLEAAGVSADAARAFLASPPAEQRKLCTAAEYGRLCLGLAELEGLLAERGRSAL